MTMFLYRIMLDCYSFCLRVFFNARFHYQRLSSSDISSLCSSPLLSSDISLLQSFSLSSSLLFSDISSLYSFSDIFLLLLPLFMVAVNVFSFLLSLSSSSLMTITSFLSFSSSLMSITGIPNFLFSFSIAASHISFVISIVTTFGTVLCGFLLKYLFLCGFFRVFFPWFCKNNY